MMSSKWVHKAVCWWIGLVALSACVAVDERLEVNPDYDCEGVVVECNIVVPQVDGQSMDSRMTSQDVQENGDFRGIDKIYLYPFQRVKGNQLKGSEIVSSDQWEILNTMTFTHQISWQQDLRVPIGTNHALLYAKASGEPGFKNGSTKTTLTKMTSVVHPPLKPRLDELTFGPQEIVQQTYLNDPRVQWAKEKFNQVAAMTYTKPNSWSGSTGEVWLISQERGLSQAYRNSIDNCYYDFILSITGQNNDQEINGSSEEMLIRLTDFYNALNNLSFSGTNGSRAEKIRNEILNQICASPTDPGQADLEYNSKKGKLQFKPSKDPDSPACIGLPYGSIKLKAELPTDAENYITGYATADYNTSSNIDILGKDVWDVYAYPAELFYFSTSAVGCSQGKQSDKAPKAWTEKNWTDFVGKNNFPDGAVGPFTRSMVIKEPMRYGVSCLVSSVDFGATYPEEFKNLELTGILIRGQRQVGWDFTHLVTGLLGDPYVVYDQYLTGKDMPLPIDPSTPNYTLLYPTAGVEGLPEYGKPEKTERVNVWLELVNKTGRNIEGYKKCVIRPDKHFYIGATLDLYQAVTKIYRTDFSQNQRHQLFEPHYKTLVTFKINNLDGALDIIPETEQTQAETGVSVDITWQQGFIFNDLEVEGDHSAPTPPDPPTPEPDPTPSPTPGPTTGQLCGPSSWRGYTGGVNGLQ